MRRLLLAFSLGLFAHAAQAQLQAAKPWLGVAIDQGAHGVLVNDVIAGTPAADAGIVKGDEITAVGETRVKTPTELIKAVQASGVGNAVVVHYLRNGQPTSKEIKLVARPDELELLKQKMVGKPAPAFDAKVVAGPGALTAEALKGKVVILEFWATWCPACRSTFPRLAELAAARAKDGLVVVAVSDEEEKTIADYAAKAKTEMVFARDASGKMQKDWMVSAIPLIAVIDRSGTVAFATIGAGQYLEEAIRAAEKAL